MHDVLQQYQSQAGCKANRFGCMTVLVNLTTVIPCLGVSQLLTFVRYSVFKLVWLKLLPTPPSTHTSLILGRLSIGCLLNNILH